MHELESDSDAESDAGGEEKGCDRCLMRYHLQARQVRGLTRNPFFDDFIIAADSQSECQRTLEIFEAVCQECGFQYAPHKEEGPSQIVQFLGVLVSTLPQLEGFTLPQDKVDKYFRSTYNSRLAVPCTSKEICTMAISWYSQHLAVI